MQRLAYATVLLAPAVWRSLGPEIAMLTLLVAIATMMLFLWLWSYTPPGDPPDTPDLGRTDLRANRIISLDHKIREEHRQQ